PVVRRGDRDGVEVFVLQGMADVLHTRWLVAALVLDLLAARPEQAAIGVDQIGDLHAFELKVLINVAIALSMDPGDADTDRVIGAKDSPRRLRAGDRKKRESGPRSGCVLEKGPTRRFHV